MKLWIEKWIKDFSSKEADAIGDAWARCGTFLRSFKLPNGSLIYVVPGQFEFLVSSEGRGYESFMFKAGDVVKTVNDPEPRLGVVKGYCHTEDGGWGIEVTLSDGDSKLHPFDVALEPIPPALMAVARRQISAKCPLMKEDCDE